MPKNDWFKDAQDKGAVQWVSDKEIRKGRIARNFGWLVGVVVALLIFLARAGEVGTLFGPTWADVVISAVVFGGLAGGLIYGMIAED